VTRFKRHFLLILLFFSVLATNYLAAQEQIERSKNKVLLNGKIYYIHIVQKGETVFSICRAYNVTENELVSENPDLAQGLKEEMTLKIPERPLVKENLVPGDTSKFIFHIIAPGETLYSLAKTYNITVEQIEDINPEVRYSSLQVNQVLKIPKKKISVNAKISSEVRKKDSIISTGTLRHIVSSGETLFSLSKRYDTSIEDIRKANGGDNWGGLRTGDTIVIPSNTGHALMISGTVNAKGIPDTSSAHHPISQWISCPCDSITRTAGETRIALLLPFHITQSIAHIDDTIDSGDDAGNYYKATTIPQNDLSLKNQIWFEFYEGFLLGLNEVKKSGIPLDLRIFDLGTEPYNSKALLSDLQLFSPTAIVTPLSDSLISNVVAYCQTNHIPVISPVYPTESLSDTLLPQFLSFEPSDNYVLSRLAEWIQSRNDSSIIVVHPGDTVSSAIVHNLRKQLPDRHIHQAIQNDTSAAKIERYLSSKDTNLVIILSEREEYVSEILRDLILLKMTYPLTVYGSPAWTKFKSIDASYYNQLDLHYLTPFYVNFGDPSIQLFTKKFTEVYGYYPYRLSGKGINYAMLGYDLCRISIPEISRYGDHFINCLPQQIPGLVLGNYSFGPLRLCGSKEKHTLWIVNYKPDYQVTATYF